jgi:hypothetical protein
MIIISDDGGLLGAVLPVGQPVSESSCMVIAATGML